MTILMCIKVGPKIVPFMRARDLQEGERLTLTCTVSKGDTPISLQWSRNGTPLNNNPTPNQAGIKVINVDQFSSMLAIARFAQSHTWTFVHFKSRARYFLLIWKLYGRLTYATIINFWFWPNTILMHQESLPKVWFFLQTLCFASWQFVADYNDKLFDWCFLIGCRWC